MAKTRPNSLSATQLQNNFGANLKKVIETARPLLVERHGKPVAALIHIDSFRRLARATPKPVSAWGKACQKLVADMRRYSRKHTSAVDLVRELREES